MRMLALAALAATLALPVSAATLHDQFTFSSDNDLGADYGSAHASGGGTVAGGRYILAANQGLTVDLATTLSSWSVVFKGQLDATDGWRKLIDLSGLVSDVGFYNLDGKLDYFPVAAGPDQLSAGSDFVAALIYDAGMTRVYLNGIEQFHFIQPGFAYPGDLSSLVFFEDDVATSKGEASGGSIDFINIYEGALSAQEVAAVSGTVPLPASAPLMLAGLAGFAALRRRKA